MKKSIAALVLVIALPAHAETMYVTEHLPIALRTAFADGSPVVKVIEGGTQLDVLERADRYARVRDAQGAEGWMEARLLVNAPPARPQLERAQTELAKLRVDLVAAQARVGQLETKLTQETARGTEPAQGVVPATTDASKVRVAVEQALLPDNTEFPWGWLVLAFAMLWIGFGAGVVWLRERHRKRLGGMYLRI